MKFRRGILTLLMVAVTVFTVAPMGAAAAAPSAPTVVPAARSSGSVTQAVTGAITDPVGGTFSGLLTITRFANQNGQLVAVGTLSGTLTDALGNTIGTITNVPVRVPVTASGTCQILHLDLGPLDLTLLGLHVHLNEVVLDITAQQGGGLLGDLLCAVANLLNGSGSLSGIAALLNQILGILAGL
jgi:hypothetical protein